MAVWVCKFMFTSLCVEGDDLRPVMVSFFYVSLPIANTWALVRDPLRRNITQSLIGIKTFVLFIGHTGHLTPKLLLSKFSRTITVQTFLKL